VIPLDEARAFVLSSCRALPARSVALDDALGCVCAFPVVATEPVPPFVNSSMDGYAVRAVDLEDASPASPVPLAVVGTVLAGSPAQPVVGPGEAVRIMTGAPLPAGADAVCMLEACVTGSGGSVVVIDGAVGPGTFLRHVGQDVAVGDTVVDAGVELTPAHLGSLANQGAAEVVVHPRPRIGVLSTGDELVETGLPLSPGGIRDANRHSLLSVVRQQGWDPVDLGIVGDDDRAVATALDEAGARCDAVLTSGGVSVGDADVVKSVLRERCGGTMRWMQVAIRPAKPFAFGVLEASGTPVFGLPGNPVSALVSFELFVRPAVRLMAGYPGLERLTVPAQLVGPIERRPDGKTHFVRSVLSLDDEGAWWVRPLLGQESHQLAVMAAANALIELPDGDGVARGDVVRVVVIAPDRLEVVPDPDRAGAPA
jgi:molybdenum cofactor synthesis domain-containing protein